MACPHVQNLFPPSAQKIISHDECTQCFTTQLVAGGVLVCLHCFNASCPSHAELHRRHFPDHQAWLQLERFPQESKEPPPKITKLAISAQDPHEDSILKTTAWCYACSAAEPTDISAQAQILRESILKAYTVGKASEVKAWEAQITACEHTLNLDTEPSNQQHLRQIDTTKLAKCEDCDLVENLWICLHCGVLGCGRRQYDGTGGNGHAALHHQQTGHIVVCKLATITPEGTADVYCYSCDEERVDPDLEKHLELLGINLAERTKTEKSLAELQLEHNLKFDFSVTSEDGQVYPPCKGPGCTGLVNLGNSCYLASVMQALFALDPIKERFQGTLATHSLSCREQDHLSCWDCQMAKLADGLLSGRFDQVRPTHFKTLCGKEHAEFASFQQQDAFEFLQHFLRLMDRQSPAQRLSSVFQFSVKHRLQCLRCKRVRRWSEQQQALQVPAAPTLREALKATITPELIAEWSCPVCGEKTGAEKTTFIETLPKVLIVHVRRYELVNWVAQKIATPLELVSETLDLTELTLDDALDAELLPTEGEEEVNPTMLAQLEEMGFPKSQCKEALLKTKQQGLEEAMNWIMENPPTFPSEEDSPFVGMLVDMGFSPDQAKLALKNTDGDVERAIEWLFNHPTSATAVTAEEQVVAGVATKHFQLRSFVSHRGSSVHSGHYVAHLQRDKKEWLMFNDEKVVEMPWEHVVKMTAKDAYVMFLEAIHFHSD